MRTQKNGQTDMATLLVAFRKYENAHEMHILKENCTFASESAEIKKTLYQRGLRKYLHFHIVQK